MAYAMFARCFSIFGLFARTTSIAGRPVPLRVGPMGRVWGRVKMLCFLVAPFACVWVCMRLKLQVAGPWRFEKKLAVGLAEVGSGSCGLGKVLATSKLHPVPQRMPKI